MRLYSPKIYACYILILAGISLAMSEVTIKIGSWHIPNLDMKKLEDKNVLDVIANVVNLYDIIALQGVEDVNVVNKISIHIGDGHRSVCRESYCFMYTWKIVGKIVHVDDENHKFFRPPLIITARYYDIDHPTFSIVNVHLTDSISPENSTREFFDLSNINGISNINNTTCRNYPIVKEMNYLSDINKQLSTDEYIIIGDYNANNVPKNCWPDIKIYNNENVFHWLIGNDVNTTIDNKSSDNIVSSRFESLAKFILVLNSAKVFHYDSFYNYSLDFAKFISNHYPIEVTLKSIPYEPERDDIMLIMIFTLVIVIYFLCVIVAYFLACRRRRHRTEYSPI